MIDFEFMAPFLQLTAPAEHTVDPKTGMADLTFDLAIILPAARGIYLDTIEWIPASGNIAYHKAIMTVGTSAAYQSNTEGFNFIMEFGSFPQAVEEGRLVDYPTNVPGKVVVEVVAGPNADPSMLARGGKTGGMALADAVIGDDPEINV